MSSKYEQLASILRSEIAQIRSQGGHKLATEAELSARYHMSRQTVRHALKLLEEEGLIIRRQGSGSFLPDPIASDDVKQIAVITTFLNDYIFPSILHDVQSCFSQSGFSTLVYATENMVSREREILSELSHKKISAILIEGSKTALPTPNTDLYQQFKSRGVPVLFLHEVYSNLQTFPCLTDDNYKGGYQLTQYLIGKGHRSIAGILKADDMPGPQRYYGMLSAMRDSGLPVCDHDFFWYDTEDRAALVQGKPCRLLQDFIERRSKEITAVICYNDEIAHLLIRQLLENGIQVPKKIAVASFDNSFFSQIGPVPVTSLGRRNSRIGKIAAELLLSIIEKKNPHSMTLEWELFIRNSA